MIGMIIQSQAESAKINAICRTSRESRGIVEDWVDVDGWGEVGELDGWVWGAGELARQHFLPPTLVLASRSTSASTLVIFSSLCRWLILPSFQD